MVKLANSKTLLFEVDGDKMIVALLLSIFFSNFDLNKNNNIT